jgi:Helix-turn-helix domain
MMQLTDAHAVFLTTSEAGSFLRISPITLGRWRIQGYGPLYRKFGRRVVYARDDLLAWANQQARSSTSDKG